MFIVDLQCANHHAFEGWYETADEFQALLSKHDVTCPLCDSSEVRRVPSASRISTGKNAPSPQPSPGKGPEPQMPLPMQKALAEVLQQVRKTHEYVGDEFAQKAIAIHRGDEKERPIYGESDSADEKRLAEEGVAFVKLPIPDIEKN